MTINKINFRSTLAALALGALVTVIPAAADTVSFGTTANPAGFGVAGDVFTFTPGTITNLLVGTTPVVLNGQSTTSSFGGFSVTGGSGSCAVLCSTNVQIDVTPTNVNGTPVAAAPLVFDGSLSFTGGPNGTYSLNFSAGDGGVAGTGAYTGDIVHTVGNVIYAVPDAIALGTKPSSFFVTGIVGAVAPEPGTLATTGLAAAFLGMFLRRKAKQNS